MAKRKQTSRWEDLVRSAAGMDGVSAAEHVRELAADPRFAAVVAFIRGHRESYVVAGSGQEMASDAGKQSHCWGSVHACQALEDGLRELLEGPVVRGPEAPEPDQGE